MVVNHLGDNRLDLGDGLVAAVKLIASAAPTDNIDHDD